MGKSKHFSGKSVFGQLIKLLPKNTIGQVIEEQDGDKYTKKFRSWDHLVTMLFGAFCRSGSIREIEAGLEGFDKRMLHTHLSHFPARSTLSDANKNRSAEVFKQLFNVSYNHLNQFLPDSCPKNQEWLKKLFLIDSTTITLFKEIMKAAGRPPADGKKKGGVKLHVGMQATEDIPSVVRITSSATHDVTFLKRLGKLPAGSILVFDKAYFDYRRYNEWQQQGLHWVTRLKRWSVVNVEQELLVSEEDQQRGVAKDQIVELGHPNQKEKVRCRLVYYYDEQRNKMFHFITNDFDKPAYQIAEIYRQRWQIELLFKRLKQNLQLSNFLGDNENAIRIQVWCNLLADLLLMVMKNGIKRNWAYSNVAALVRIHLMNYVNIKELLNNAGKKAKASTREDRQMEFAHVIPP